MKMCETCHAMVNAESFDLHLDWHTRLDQTLSRLLTRTDPRYGAE